MNYSVVVRVYVFEWVFLAVYCDRAMVWFDALTGESADQDG
jgi:uncharacterized membrane protein (DUF485 family)